MTLPSGRTRSSIRGYAEELEQMQSALEHLLVVLLLIFFGGGPAVGRLDRARLVGYRLRAMGARRPAASGRSAGACPDDNPAHPCGVPLVVRADRRRGDLIRALRRAVPARGVRPALRGVHAGHRGLRRRLLRAATPGVRRFAGRDALTNMCRPLTRDVDGAP